MLNLQPFCNSNKYEKYYWTRNGVHTTAVTAGHCMQAERPAAAGMLRLAVTAVTCTPVVYVN